jgi:hypothetical protein
MNEDDGASVSKHPPSDAPTSLPIASPAASIAASPGLAYAEFVGALKDALRDLRRADLLARKPLMRDGILNLGGSAGPRELREVLVETVGNCSAMARGEKLRRVIKLTYFQPAPKQEAVADRLSLSFGTCRHYLTIARDRVARWLWERSRVAQAQPSTTKPTAKPVKLAGEIATSSEAARARRRLPRTYAAGHGRRAGDRTVCTRTGPGGLCV